VSVNSMQPTNLTRSAPQASTTVASSTREDQPVIAAQPTRAEQTAASAAQQTDDSTTAFADELAQVADDQQPLLQPDAKAPAEQPVTEADAEQWLLHMLEQQATQLQARDAEHGRTDETHEANNAAIRALPGALAAQEFAEQAPTNQTLKVSIETLKASAEHLAAGKVSAAVSGAASTQLQAVGKQPEKVKLDPALLDSESANQPLIAQLERLAAGASSMSGEVATRIDSTLMNPPVTESAALERTLKLQGPETKGGEQLLQALRDNVELQTQQRVQNTTIRLDPPEMGKMEIILTHEQGRLNVQISAQHSDVVRLLQQTSDRLRHELVAQNFTQVDVEISGGQSGQHHSPRDQARLANEQSVLANQHEADQSDAHHLAPAQQKSAQHNGVLVTV
jgi:flagellar hook-length control protein FliK